MGQRIYKAGHDQCGGADEAAECHIHAASLAAALMRAKGTKGCTWPGAFSQKNCCKHQQVLSFTVKGTRSLKSTADP